MSLNPSKANSAIHPSKMYRSQCKQLTPLNTAGTVPLLQTLFFTVCYSAEVVQ